MNPLIADILALVAILRAQPLDWKAALKATLKLIADVTAGLGAMPTAQQARFAAMRPKSAMDLASELETEANAVSGPIADKLLAILMALLMKLLGL